MSATPVNMNPIPVQAYEFAQALAGNDSHSVKALPDLGGIDATAAAHKRFGEAVISLEGLAYQLNRAFDLLEQATAQMLESGVRAEPILPAPIQAALTAWQANKVTEAPLGAPIP